MTESRFSVTSLEGAQFLKPDGTPYPENDGDGEVLAGFYADLWNLIQQAGVEIPDDEIAEAHDELKGMGWTLARHGKEWKAQEGGGGIKLSQDVVLAQPQGKMKSWARYVGPKGGVGWRNVTTGEITYGGADPNEGGDVHVRLEEARKRRMKDRKSRPRPPVPEHLKVPVQQDPVTRRETVKAFLALSRYHKEDAQDRFAEIATLIKDAVEKTQSPELKRELFIRYAAVHHMLPSQQGAPQGGMPVQPQKPQSQFLPKRGTS